MKILHVAETIKGGVATVLRQIALMQSTDNLVESVICLVPNNQVSELLPLSGSHIVTFKRSSRSVKSLISFTFSFIRIIIKSRPDIIHLHSSFAGFIGRTILFFISPFFRPKIIYCPHAFSFIMNANVMKLKIYGFLEKILSHMTDVIICVSNYEKKIALEYGLPDKKMIIIYNGVPQVDPATYTKLVDPYQGDIINMLFVGRFDYQKGFDILQQLMKQLEGKPFHLTAVGDFVHGDTKTFASMKEMRQTTFVGWLDNEKLTKFYKFADFIIIPSRWEGFAMVPLEAMSHGLPVIASNCTSFPEVVVNGETGFLFTTENSIEIEKILLSTEKTTWQAMGENSLELYLTKFTSVKMLRQYSLLYEFLFNMNNKNIINQIKLDDFFDS